MIPIIGYNEDISQFPKTSIAMNMETSKEIETKIINHFKAKEVVYAGRGFNNAHHVVIGVENTPKFVLRRVLFPVPALEKRISREYRVLEHLDTFSYPHSPKPIKKITKGQIDNCPGLAMTYIEGSNPGFSKGVVKEMGKAIRALHEVPVPNWLNEGFSTDPRDILKRMLDTLRLKASLISPKMEKLDREKLERVLNMLTLELPKLKWGSEKKVILHGDLGDHNFLIESKTNNLYLIDWEFCSVSDRVLDLMWLFNRVGFDDSKYEEFLLGYGEHHAHTWEDKIEILKTLCLVEDVIWSQSGVADIQEEQNSHYFKEEDLNILSLVVKRIHEISTINRSMR